MIKNILKNQFGGTLLILTIIILTAVLTVVMAVADIVRNGLIIDRTQLESTKAFFAAEAGAERILWELRHNTLNPDPPNGGGHPCLSGNYFCFDVIDINISDIKDQACQDLDGGGSCNNVDYQGLSSNNSTYQLKYEHIDDGINATTTLTSIGKFQNVGRNVQLRFRN